MTTSKPNRSRARAAKRPSQAAKVGLAPGALIHLGERKTQQPTITLIEYGDTEILEYSFASIADAKAHTPTLPVLWLNVHGLHEPEVMAEIGRRFKLHPLVLEDILNTNQRPKVDDYGDGICEGAIENRMALSSTGKSFPRCEKHFEARLKTQDEINERYPTLPPSDFDPAYAGERWDEDY